jgi:DNA-binding transcriptional MerR regulator
MDPQSPNPSPTERVIPPTRLGVRAKPLAEAPEPDQTQMPKAGKLYYTIGEVGLLLGVKPTLIRFWETEFPHIRPKTNKKGDRRYRQNDIQAVKLIHHLVKEKGYTLQGARDYINTKQQHSKQDVLNKLKEIRKFMQDLRELLGTPVGH